MGGGEGPCRGDGCQDGEREPTAGSVFIEPKVSLIVFSSPEVVLAAMTEAAPMAGPSASPLV